MGQPVMTQSWLEHVIYKLARGGYDLAWHKSASDEYSLAQPRGENLARHGPPKTGPNRAWAGPAWPVSDIRAVPCQAQPLEGQPSMAQGTALVVPCWARPQSGLGRAAHGLPTDPPPLYLFIFLIFFNNYMGIQIPSIRKHIIQNP